MNLADQLRTLPELEAYLKARTVFPPEELRIIGNEEALFSLYLLNGGTFGSCSSRAEALAQLAQHNDKLITIIQQKKDAEQHCLLMEKVADFLATRNPNVPADLESHYEPLANRVGYLKMQALLANMQFRDRVGLGRSFSQIIDSMRHQQKGFACVANAVDYLPDTVFVFGSSKKWDQSEIVKLFPLFTQSAMAHYGKTECLMVVDRDGEHFELCLVKAPSVPTDPKVIEFGRKTFGKITSRPMDFHG